MSFDAIAKTSLLVAAMRAVETKRSEDEGRLFNDPFAEALAGSEGFSLLEQVRAEVGEQPSIALRTRYFDERIGEGLAQGIRQIVILAAGLDARAYRLSFPAGTRVFELERQEVLNYKQEKLGNTLPHCARYAVGVDLREDWQSKLIQAGMNAAERTLWLVEGLLLYLDEAAVLTLFEKIDSLSAPDSILLFDVLGRSLLDAPQMAKQLQFSEKLGAPWLFGVDEPEEFMEQFGWKAVATQPGEVEPARWRFPNAPRHIPNVPRIFFVEARKLG
ncbi:MAG TPA: SAM-dependent methyltransferase [Pyrinomonadaceae bacterium]|nr:SAM-dependent methyltransferase [Pyrinomonadaceae bacterium]